MTERTNNVLTLPGFASPQTGKPSERLIEVIRGLLARAESGSLQQLVAVGINSDNTVLTAFATCGEDVYSMQGALSAITIEHARRNGLLGT